MTSKRYDLPHLAFFQGFEAAARTLSFTKAAEELFITQSAVSRQIKALEDHLGLKLFERRPRSLVLTESGQALLRGTLEERLFLGSGYRHYVRIEGESVMVDGTEPVEAGPVTVRVPVEKLKIYAMASPEPVTDPARSTRTL